MVAFGKSPVRKGGGERRRSYRALFLQTGNRHLRGRCPQRPANVAAVVVVPAVHSKLTANWNALRGNANSGFARLPGGGRGANHLRPDPSASGAHTTIRRGASGQITHYETLVPNPRNPNGFDWQIRYHGIGGTHNGVPTPHVHVRDKLYPKGVRKPFPWEYPDWRG